MKTRELTINNLPLANSANRALNQFQQLSRLTLPFTGAELLYERALLLDLKANGNISPGGSCRLLRCRDGMLVLNLPRESDWELLPAWLQQPVSLMQEDWQRLEDLLLPLPKEALLEQGYALGLAVAAVDCPPKPPENFVDIEPSPSSSPTQSSAPRQRPLVVDLSPLWAGPLCGYLLTQAGCRVIKVESVQRPDGARQGNQKFYRLLNQGKESLALDFRNAEDIVRLQKLIDCADIVIEGSRPRALQNLGIDAEACVRSGRGLVWVSITGYGRDETSANRVGFGDDAAAAAGLSATAHEATGEWLMVGDAIGDPLTGIHAALAAWQSLQRGGNELLALSLQGVIAYCLHQELKQSSHEVLDSICNWQTAGQEIPKLFRQGVRNAHAPTRKLGADTNRIIEEFGLANRAPSPTTSTRAL